MRPTAAQASRYTNTSSSAAAQAEAQAAAQVEAPGEAHAEAQVEAKAEAQVEGASKGAIGGASGGASRGARRSASGGESGGESGGASTREDSRTEVPSARATSASTGRCIGRKQPNQTQSDLSADWQFKRRLGATQGWLRPGRLGIQCRHLTEDALVVAVSTAYCVTGEIKCNRICPRGGRSSGVWAPPRGSLEWRQGDIASTGGCIGRDRQSDTIGSALARQVKRCLPVHMKPMECKKAYSGTEPGLQEGYIGLGDRGILSSRGASGSASRGASGSASRSASGGASGGESGGASRGEPPATASSVPTVRYIGRVGQNVLETRAYGDFSSQAAVQFLESYAGCGDMSKKEKRWQNPRPKSRNLNPNPRGENGKKRGKREKGGRKSTAKQMSFYRSTETVENDQTGLPPWAAAVTAQIQKVFTEQLGVHLAAQAQANRAELQDLIGECRTTPTLLLRVLRCYEPRQSQMFACCLPK